jgi:hypothetical protein
MVAVVGDDVEEEDDTLGNRQAALLWRLMSEFHEAMSNSAAITMAVPLLTFSGEAARVARVSVLARFLATAGNSTTLLADGMRQQDIVSSCRHPT